MSTNIPIPNAPAAGRPYSLFVGIDRSDATLDTEALEPSGRAPRQRKVSTRPEALLEWATSLRPDDPGARVAVCIEQPCANIASFLGQFDFIDLFPVNPVLVSHYRDSFHTARPKDDVTDAALIARFLFERHASLEPWRPASAEMRQLRAYLEHRRLLVDTVTETTNRLTAALKAYYPQALELSGKRLDAPLACRFLERFPDLEALMAAPAGELRAFYYANACRRQSAVEKRVAAAAGAVPITTDGGIVVPQRELALFLVKQLDLLRAQIARYGSLVAGIMSTHEDAAIFEALPGAGPNLSARLLSTFGDDRSRYPTPESVQRYSGIAPVTKQSGQKRHVHRRFTKCTCPHFEHQTFVEWVGQTLLKPGWARAYYDTQRARKVGHWAIIRALAYKWIRILHRCWIDRVPYDEARYQKALHKAGSPVAATLPKAA
jgi:transposase